MEQSKEFLRSKKINCDHSFATINKDGWIQPFTLYTILDEFADQQVKKALSLNSEFTPIGDLNLRGDKRYIVSGESKEVITDAVYDADCKKWWDSQCTEIIGVTHAMEVPEFYSAPTQTKIQLLTIIEDLQKEKDKYLKTVGEMHDRIVELEADVKERDKRIKELEEFIANIKY